MAIRLRLLAMTLLFLPVMALGQSYEWSDRLTGQARVTTGLDWQVVASEHRHLFGRIHGAMSRARECLSKFRAADGQLLWRRKLALESLTYRPFGCRQRSRRVCCRELLK